MELDVQLKFGKHTLLFSVEKLSEFWSFVAQKNQDWNHEYFLVERDIKEVTFLIFSFTLITTNTTDIKWTDGYVMGLDKLNNTLENNDKQFLNIIEGTENITTDPQKRLNIVTRGRLNIEKSEDCFPPVKIIQEFLQKEEPSQKTLVELVDDTHKKSAGKIVTQRSSKKKIKTSRIKK